MQQYTNATNSVSFCVHFHLEHSNAHVQSVVMRQIQYRSTDPTLPGQEDQGRPPNHDKVEVFEQLVVVHVQQFDRHGCRS